MTVLADVTEGEPMWEAAMQLATPARTPATRHTATEGQNQNLTWEKGREGGKILLGRQSYNERTLKTPRQKMKTSCERE